MLTMNRKRPDLLLLLSLLLVILTGPVLDHGRFRPVVLGTLIFVPIVLATVRLSEIRGWVWPSTVLAVATLVVSGVSTVWPTPPLLGMKWVFLTAFFGLTVVGLFSHLKDARVVTQEHLLTAASIYLLLGMTWFTLYSAINVFYPGVIRLSGAEQYGGQSELLYFSLVTLSTIGYGDVVPLHPEVRMLAALEGITGVLFIAITVAILASSFKHHLDSH